MGVSRIENIFRIRTLLDLPYPNKPSFAQLFQQELSEERDIVNQTNNTGKPWATATYQLNYTPNQSEYAINVEDWGKVLMVLKETTNPYIPYLPVAFDDLSEMQYGQIIQWFNNSYAQAFALSEAPERMAFYRSGVVNSSYMVKVEPLPQQSVTYIITYIPGYLGDGDPLETSIQLPEHAELVRLRAAMALLNYTSWHEDEVLNRQKRQDLATGFLYQLERKEKLFADYIRSINIPRMTDVDSWNWAS